MTSQLTSARMSYGAAVVGCVGYGCYAIIALIAIHYLIRRRRRTPSQRLVLAYSVLLFAVNTTYFIAAAKWSEIEFVETTVNPGLFATLESSPVAKLKNTTFTIGIWLADSLIIYRLYIIWGGSVWITILPFLMWLSSLATGIGLLVESSRPGGALGQTGVISFGTPFYCLSIAVNVLCTILITGKLWYHHRKMSKYNFSSHHGYYMALAMIFIESSAFYSVVGIIYIPLFVLNMPLSFVFVSLLGSASVIAPTLIVLRMALGIAITRETASDPLYSFRSAASFKMGTLRPDGTRHTENTSRTAFDAVSNGKSKSALNIAATDSYVFQDAKGTLTPANDHDLEAN